MPDGLDSVFQKVLIYWDFPTKPSLGFTENFLKKYPVGSSSQGESALLMTTLAADYTKVALQSAKIKVEQSIITWSDKF